MEPRDYARLAAALLARRSERAHSTPDLPVQLDRARVDREAGISAVARGIAERNRRRQRARWLSIMAGLAAAASVALVAGFLGGRHGVRVESAALNALGSGDSRAGRLESGRAFTPGERLVTDGAHASTLEFGAVTRLTLAPTSELEFREGGATRRFGLLKGSLRLVVEKLKRGERFLVHTPDTEVEVHGTVFEVEWLDENSCGGPRTRVRVQEGVVSVRSRDTSVRLAAGEVWPQHVCDARAAVAETQSMAPISSSPPASLSAPLPGSSRVTAPKARGARSGAEPVRSAVSSDLNRQNDLYASAVSARRAGEVSLALSRFERLLSEFPSSPLTESALVERMRLLRSSEPERARVAARSYLARFPRGFARAEAERLTD